MYEGPRLLFVLLVLDLLALRWYLYFRSLSNEISKFFVMKFSTLSFTCSLVVWLVSIHSPLLVLRRTVAPKGNSK